MFTRPFHDNRRATGFVNRADAGSRLARELSAFKDRRDVMVLALPRGGVPVAFEVARALRAPLDVFVVRKLGVPGFPELALGAIATGGVRVLNHDVVRELGIGPEQIDAVTVAEERELDRRELAYRGHTPALRLRGHTVILVDDGLATGATMRAAVMAARRLEADRIVVAIPVAPRSTCETLQRDADDVVCLLQPSPFRAIGEWYDDFSQVSDDEVRDMLAKAAGVSRPPQWPPHGGVP